MQAVGTMQDSSTPRNILSLRTQHLSRVNKLGSERF